MLPLIRRRATTVPPSSRRGPFPRAAAHRNTVYVGPNRLRATLRELLPDEGDGEA